LCISEAKIPKSPAIRYAPQLLPVSTDSLNGCARRQRSPKPDPPKGRAPAIPTAAATVDLPPLSSLVPKLEHLGTSRPRRMKTKAMTRPTMPTNNGVGGFEDGITEETEEDLFGGSMGRSVAPPPVAGGTVAGGTQVEKKVERRFVYCVIIYFASLL